MIDLRRYVRASVVGSRRSPSAFRWSTTDCCLPLFALIVACILLLFPALSSSAQDARGDDASLDELLGLEEDEEARRAQEAADRRRQEALDRALLEQRIDDNFKQALALMTNSAELLAERFDAGLPTQRVQEEILAKLDDLINSARQQQQQSSSSSSSQQQQQQQSRPRPQQQDSKGAEQPGDQSLESEATTVQQPPDQAADINQLLDEMGVEWGALPERTREQLMQSFRERPSILYQRLTGEYFRRLAESD